MKTTICVYFVLILFAALSCSSKDNNIVFPPQELTLVDSIVLEENEALILLSIEDCDINKNSEKIVITSSLNQIIAIYNYKNGKIIKFCKAGPYLSDSIKNSNRKPPPNPFNPIIANPIKYLSLKECQDMGWTDFNEFRNDFQKVIINNDNSISSLAYLMLPVLLEDNKTSVFNTAAVVEFDSNLIIKKVIYPNHDYINYTTTDAFVNDKKNSQYYIQIFTPQAYTYLPVKDSIPVLAIYDKEGDFIKIGLFLDKKFSNLHRKFSNEEIFESYFLYQPTTTTIGDKIFAMLYYDPNTIYELKSDKVINLTPPIIDYSTKYDEYLNLIRKPNNKQNKFATADKCMPLSACNIMNNGKNLIVCYKVALNDELSYIFKEYDLAGKLISERSFLNREIQNMIYDKENNLLVLFIKGEENWTMEKYRW
ncbi:MAG: hypothetical protein GX121_02855 [Ignavibacteria bacterium]|nr:hypothetical protein [Ignavibacteria bacterium]